MYYILFVCFMNKLSGLCPLVRYEQIIVSFVCLLVCLSVCLKMFWNNWWEVKWWQRSCTSGEGYCRTRFRTLFWGTGIVYTGFELFFWGGGRIQDLDVHVTSFTSNKDHLTSIFQNKSVYLCVNYWSKYHLVLNHLSTLWNSQMSIGVFSVGFCIVRRNLILLQSLYMLFEL